MKTSKVGFEEESPCAYSKQQAEILVVKNMFEAIRLLLATRLQSMQKQINIKQEKLVLIDNRYGTQSWVKMIAFPIKYS